MFEIRIKEGNEEKKHHLAASKVKSIIITTSAAISSDAVKLAIMNNIDIVFTEKDGTPLGRVWHSKLGSTTKIRKVQLECSMNAVGLKWVKTWIGIKIENQVNFIIDLKKHRPDDAVFLDDKIKRMSEIKASIDQLEAPCVGDVADKIRGLEGTSGRLYFETLTRVLPKTYRFDGRSSRPAKDPFNAFLNYGYGILYGRIEKSLIVAGLDPYLGFLHRDDYNQLSFVYDFIEPYRIYAENVVFRLFSGKKVNKSHTDEITNGFTLNKEGKVLLVEAFNKYTEQDVIRYKGRNQTRMNALQMDAHEFANGLIK
jgi:CRISP-associated protein Cas1